MSKIRTLYLMNFKGLAITRGGAGGYQYVLGISCSVFFAIWREQNPECLNIFFIEARKVG